MRPYYLLVALMLVVLTAAPAMAGDTEPLAYYGSQMGLGNGMMGPGYGMGYGMGYYGMMGPGYGMHGGYYGGGMGPGYHGWQGMSQADRDRWNSMRAQFHKETLQLRQKLASDQMELQTEWSQPKPDMKKVRKLSDQITELRAELEKKRNQFLSQCRENFGDRGWTCPAINY